MIYVDSTIGNGKFIGEYKELTSLTEDCLFVVAQSGVSSLTISYKDLRRELMNGMKRGLSVGSMAYKRSFQYARHDHIHEGAYNHVSFEGKYNVEDRGEDKLDVLATLSSSDMQSPQYMYAPKIQVKDQDTPTIGTVKFVYNKNSHFRGLSGINSEDFNGWIVPDGQKLRIQDITNQNYDWINHIYYNSSDQTLDIPLISDFIRFNPEPSANINTVIPFVDDVPKHRHSMYGLSGELSFSMDSSSGDMDFRIKGSKANTEHGILISGKESSLSAENIRSYVKLNTQGLDFVISSAQTETQTYPNYDSVPVILFIGGSFSGK